jgi:hypothetical protein
MFSRRYPQAYRNFAFICEYDPSRNSSCLRNLKCLKSLGDGFLVYQAVIRGPFVLTLKLAYEVHTLVIVLLAVSVLKQVRFAKAVGA